jgi:FixJ family two-component response regulator
MEVLKVLRCQNLDIPMILVSGALGDVLAVECIRRGATDYVLKDGLARLPEVIRRALQEKYERSSFRICWLFHGSAAPMALIRTLIAMP